MVPPNGAECLEARSGEVKHRFGVSRGSGLGWPSPRRDRGSTVVRCRRAGAWLHETLLVILSSTTSKEWHR